ncbi:phosphoribosyltransferase [Alkalilacustris brevis]|uniref:phosphoribosyltransferase n=1 Tax=Alkalilacustris brevis TaxID=2026338 RepID=UPI000E0D8D37|nr:phosphoribosyltransferase [Alkalilacustris brevis]
MFANRAEAGERLADRVLQELAAQAPGGGSGTAPLVLALPRGGVPVALPVARRLNAPLDLVLVRKIGVPGAPELAAGAVMEGAEGPQAVFNDDVLALHGLTPDDLHDSITRLRAEIADRRARYLQGRAPIPVNGRQVVVVDDGIATGATMRAALAGLGGQGAAEVILAVPVAPPAALARLSGVCDRVICLESPLHFQAVGQFYRDFTQVSDDEVIATLQTALPLRDPDDNDRNERK